ncbi:MAG: ATP synthase F1 subunit epsilon [Actinomycetota bacterium]|nr:ATP synthase F1 subunit epsilon [Actinomycetota bacterium]
MAATMHAELLTPERCLFSGDATFVMARTGDGDIAFLANHAPFIGTVEICVVKVERPGATDLFAAVHGGFVHVAKNQVTILADVAELADEIDVARARRAVERAEQALVHANDTSVEAALRRAHVRLAVSETFTRHS